MNNQEEQIDKVTLFQFKKESLLHAITEFSISRDLYRNYQWRLRALLFALSGAFITLCINSKDFKCLPINVWLQLLISVIIFLLFYLFDAHLNDLIKSLIRGRDATIKKLNKLSTSSYDRLQRLKTHEPVRKEVKGLRNWFKKRAYPKMKGTCAFDFFVVYIFFTLVLFCGWFIR